MKNIDIARLTPETWPARREALVKLFGQEEYGVVPAGWTSSFVWEKELEKDGLHGRLGCVTVEYKGRSMSFPFALWLPEKTSEPVPCAIQISCHDHVVHDQMKGIDPAMREKFMGMMKELIGNEDHFNVMIDDMMAPKEPNTLDITCDVEKGYWPVRQLLAAPPPFPPAARQPGAVSPRPVCVKRSRGRERTRLQTGSPRGTAPEARAGHLFSASSRLHLTYRVIML